MIDFHLLSLEEALKMPLTILRFCIRGVNTFPRGLFELINLEHLIIENCQFEEIPEEIQVLKEIRNLEIKNTALKDIPQCLGSLKKLQTLHFDHCVIKKKSNFYSGFEQVQNLVIQNSALKEFPKWVFTLKELETLNLKQNKIHQLPKQFYGLKKLKFLDISGNKIKVLPESIEKLRGLEHIDCSENRLKYLPLKLVNLKNLKSLNFRNNRLKKLKENFYKLSKLEWLDLSKNAFKNLPLVLAKMSFSQIVIEDLFLKKKLIRSSQLRAFIRLNQKKWQLSPEEILPYFALFFQVDHIAKRLSKNRLLKVWECDKRRFYASFVYYLQQLPFYNLKEHTLQKGDKISYFQKPYTNLKILYDRCLQSGLVLSKDLKFSRFKYTLLPPPDKAHKLEVAVFEKGKGIPITEAQLNRHLDQELFPKINHHTFNQLKTLLHSRLETDIVLALNIVEGIGGSIDLHTDLFLLIGILDNYELVSKIQKWYFLPRAYFFAFTLLAKYPLNSSKYFVLDPNFYAILEQHAIAGLDLRKITFFLLEQGRLKKGQYQERFPLVVKKMYIAYYFITKNRCVFEDQIPKSNTFPNTIFEFPTLKELEICTVSTFKNVADRFDSLADLEILALPNIYLSARNFKQLPPSFFRLKKLKKVNLKKITSHAKDKLLAKFPKLQIQVISKTGEAKDSPIFRYEEEDL